jgi:hypothetical protein
MIKWLFKYGAVIFLFNTVLLSIKSTFDLGNQIFLAIMGIFTIFLLINPKQIKIVIFHKAFSFLLIINSLNLLYFILFHSVSDIEAIKYLLARAMQFTIISISIYFHFDYYKTQFLNHIASLVLFIVILSLLFYPNVFSLRYEGIIWNSNMLASFIVIAFSILFLKNEDKSLRDYIPLFLLLIIALATGSRGALVGLAICIGLKYGFSLRNIIYSIIAFSIYFIVSSINLDTSINRFAEQSIFNDRIEQAFFAIENINKSLFSGYGLNEYSGLPKDISLPKRFKGQIMTSHNGYLSILLQYGVLFGGFILALIFVKASQLISFFRFSNDSEKVFIFIIIYTFVSSIYETLITGINEFHTILFWFSLAFLSYSKFKKDYEN